MPDIKILDAVEVEQIAEQVARRLLAEAPGAAGACENLVTARVAAEAVGITERHLRQLATEPNFPCYRFGTALRFKVSELQEHGRVAEKRARLKEAS